MVDVIVSQRNNIKHHEFHSKEYAVNWVIDDIYENAEVDAEAYRDELEQTNRIVVPVGIDWDMTDFVEYAIY